MTFIQFQYFILSIRSLVFFSSLFLSLENLSFSKHIKPLNSKPIHYPPPTFIPHPLPLSLSLSLSSPVHFSRISLVSFSRAPYFSLVPWTNKIIPSTKAPLPIPYLDILLSVEIEASLKRHLHYAALIIWRRTTPALDGSYTVGMTINSDVESPVNELRIIPTCYHTSSEFNWPIKK